MDGDKLTRNKRFMKMRIEKWIQKFGFDPYNLRRGSVGDYQEGYKTLFNQGLFEESTTQKERLGTFRKTDDGRFFRYCGVTAATLTAGCLISKVQTPVDATVAAADALLCTKGAREISLTIAGATADLYKDGEAVVKAGTNIGAKYKIRGNTATGNPAAGRASISLYDKLGAAWVTASTTVAVHENPYKDLLLNPAVADEAATTQETVMGVTLREVSASSYIWVQTHGVASVVLDVAAAAGAEANEMWITSGVTAGRAALTDGTALLGTQIVGYILESADLTDAEGNLVFLTIE